MHNINSRKNNMKVGYTIFSGLVILILFTIIVGTGENFFSKTYNLNLAVKETEGLKKGGAVLLGGLKIGNITDIEIVPEDNNNKIILELSILQEYAGKITAGSTASIETLGLLGDKMVNISLGKYNEEPLREGDFLKVKESFSLETAGTAIGPILSKLDGIVTDVKTITGKVSAGNGTIGKLLVEDSAVDKLDKIIEEITSIVSSINSSKGLIGKLINEPGLYHDLASITLNIKTITDSLASGKGTIGKLLRDDLLYNEVNNITSGLNNIIRITEKDSTLIGGSLNDKNLYIKLNTLIDELNFLVTDIRENPKRYINVSVF